MVDVEWAGQTFRLRADRSAFWIERSTLIVADPHFGKAEHFRRSGIPVPHGTTNHALDRLDVALRATEARRLIVLGDFFHNRGGVCERLLEELSQWRRRWDGLEALNLRGNHDRQAGDPPAELEVRCVAGPWHDPEEPTIAFAHEPTVVANASTLCGHLHPGVSLEGLANTRLRAPCFHFGPRSAVLPAFGAFTGLKIIRPKRSDRVFAIGPGCVVDVSPTRPAARPSPSRSK